MFSAIVISIRYQYVWIIVYCIVISPLVFGWLYSFCKNGTVRQQVRLSILTYSVVWFFSALIKTDVIFYVAYLIMVAIGGICIRYVMFSDIKKQEERGVTAVRSKLARQQEEVFAQMSLPEREQALAEYRKKAPRIIRWWEVVLYDAGGFALGAAVSLLFCFRVI